ncbi:ribonuclease HII [Parvularcula oceani]|uniref:ribonuclease HII n=1 Tax=Parvularcula oceani TaxID=1247963 RepID=UPI000691ABB7|nr:ribonuclease HII [Parvularcula oceani]
MRTPPSFALEDEFGGVVAGIDEVGRGPWAGPVVACAVILDRERCPQGLGDSKKLTQKRREAACAAVEETACYALGVVEVPLLDELGIGKATLLAMSRAVAALPRRPDAVLVDGTQLPDTGGIPARAVPRADALSASVAAASIVAKVRRDAHLRELAEDFPPYGWERNKGYGTKDHAEALARHGVTPHHRRSFAPIKRLLATTS